MKKISSYLWEYRLSYLGAVLSLLIAVTLDMLTPRLMARMVDEVIVGGQIAELPGLLLGFLGIGLGRCVFQYFKEYTFDKNGARISGDMRRDLFCHIQGLSADFFDRTNTGELMARVKEDIDKIWDALGYVGMLLIEVVYHTVIILTSMYLLDWRMAVIPTLAMILCGSFAVIMERKLGRVYEEISEENAALNTVAEENLAGVRTVKAFAREKFEIGKFLSHNKRYYELNMEQSKVFVRFYPCFTVVTRVLPLLTILVGGKFVIAGTMTLGQLTAFVEYSGNIVWPMEMLGWLTNSFSAAVASNKKIRRIYAEKPSVTEVTEPVKLENVRGKVCFDHVSFHKADGYEILHDISFTVEAGGTLGIMGATGAGKTSIVQLLQRMYDATDGTIFLDDVDIRKLSLAKLRTNISYVMQDVFLFSDTIQENIKLGERAYIDFKTVRRASTQAQADGFIERMEDRYDTVIGERGVGLSGGQKQRISIARALAKKDPILVMDDSTSALDMETEQQIQHMLQTLANTTKIIIAHRISAVRSADEILVLEDGRIAERGTHETLLAKRGLYYETYLSQYGEPQKGGETNALQFV
ncbi:MAG: ABC transporter ATP-binding protein/permease [Bacteroidales bacterium]|nr:ABC transporter ATP-binding protein/permease [Bacteroidales bacterium]MCM1414844.1 ABC transporter ATP-binding protein/permease [bacterium]MCM1422475.1 ABC transporter ATP-binding protein/permease [bacterium]